MIHSGNPVRTLILFTFPCMKVLESASSHLIEFIVFTNPTLRISIILLVYRTNYKKYS